MNKILIIGILLSINFPVFATTGISAGGYVWVIGLFLVGLIFLMIWIFRFLSKIRRDSLKNDNPKK